jgi:hypothetical protein
LIREGVELARLARMIRSWSRLMSIHQRFLC